jgi:hypothetical protein
LLFSNKGISIRETYSSFTTFTTQYAPLDCRVMKVLDYVQ